MLLLSQTLTALEKQQVLDQAVKAGDNYHLDKYGPPGLSQTEPSQEEEGEEEERQRHWIPKREPQSPISTGGDQAVPSYDPKWDPENDKDEWSCDHFIHCNLEGLRGAKVKPLNYSQFKAMHQGPLEAPVIFLQRLKDALQQYTNIVPESQEEEIILKDKFLT
jgi:hypothetical protein